MNLLKDKADSESNVLELYASFPQELHKVFNLPVKGHEACLFTKDSCL